MKKIALISTLALLSLGLPACDQANEESHGHGTKISDLTAVNLEGRLLRVTTTINIIGDLARQIGGNSIEVTELMGPGVDPHLYKASAGDVSKLQDADLVLYGGLHLEGKMVELLEKSDKAISVTQNISKDKLIKTQEATDNSAASYDPHVWFDATLWKNAAETVRDALVAIDPNNADQYNTNATAYVQKLEALDQEVSQLMSAIPKKQRVLITAHDAFHYFGRRYNVEVRGVQGISTAAEAGTRDVQELADFARERGVKALFVESSVPKRTVEAVIAAAKAKGHSISLGGELFSDALGSANTPEGNYLGMVRHNAKQISQALAGEQ